MADIPRANTFIKTDGSYQRKLPTNLYDYYQSQGRSLPSVSERASLYGDPNYTGTAEQNTTQLQRLLNQTPSVSSGGSSTTAINSPMSAAPASPAAPASSAPPITDNPYDAFNLLIQEKLKQAQTINPTELLKQQRALQRQRIAKMQGTGTTTPTAEELRFLSPEQQSAMRSADVETLTPAIDEVAYQIQKTNQDRQDLIEQIILARDSGDKAREAQMEAEYQKADQAYKEAVLAETIRSNKASESVAQSKITSSSGGGSSVSGIQGGVEGEVVSNDPFIQSLYNTKGGKSLTDTSIQKLDKGLTVLNQLGVLQANVEGVKTGPIVGIFKEKNPWDTQAQTIKTSLNAIVPNLARGVYGEVGVLTDNDIATYSKTIPNLRSTEEVRNAVLYITLDMIGKSVRNTLAVNAAAGRDVSGFVDIYTEMEATKNSILSSIPGAQVPKAFQEQQTETEFSDIQNSLRIEGNTIYIPRSVWASLGARQDALLAEVEADGGKLLVDDDVSSGGGGNW